MAPCISIGNQGFESIREENSFYIDKSDFIREWWESADVMTLITRPRRFGKTLNMSMVNCFFSNQYAGRSDLFEGLSVWKEEKYRKLQGTYPVIFLSFADVKQTNYEDAVRKIKNIIEETYMQHAYLNEAENISETEKRQLRSVSETMGDVTAQDSLKNLAGSYTDIMGKKPSSCWMNMTLRCRKHIFTDTGMSLPHLSAVFLIPVSRPILTWSAGS